MDTKSPTDLVKTLRDTADNIHSRGWAIAQAHLRSAADYITRDKDAEYANRAHLLGILGAVDNEGLTAAILRVVTERDTLKKAVTLEAPLLARCVPPEYMVEPAPRSCEKEWVWDSCDDDWNGYGEADSREQALADAWIHWQARSRSASTTARKRSV